MKISFWVKTALIVWSSSLGGCSTTQIDSSVEKGPQDTIAYVIAVEASDPGTKIEVNGDYVGEAPCSIKLFGDKDGTFHNFGSNHYTVKAYPSHSGLYQQEKVFQTGGWFGPEDKIPKRLYFDMKSPSLPAPH